MSRHRSKHLVHITRVPTNAKGICRIRLVRPPGAFMIRIFGKHRGRFDSVTRRIVLPLHHAYRISATVTGRAFFASLPVSSY